MTSFYALKQPWRWCDRSVRDESVCVSTIAAPAIIAALIPWQSAHSRATTTCAGRRPSSRTVQVQPTIEPTRQRSHSELFATGVWTHESMRVPTWHLQETNSCHGLPAGCGHRLPSAMDGAWLNLGPTLVKVLVLPGEDPPFFTLAVPGSHRAGPYDPGGAPYGRREHGRFRRTDGQIPGGGKGLNALQCPDDTVGSM